MLVCHESWSAVAGAPFCAKRAVPHQARFSDVVLGQRKGAPATGHSSASTGRVTCVCGDYILFTRWRGGDFGSGREHQQQVLAANLLCGAQQNYIQRRSSHHATFSCDGLSRYKSHGPCASSGHSPRRCSGNAKAYGSTPNSTDECEAQTHQELSFVL